MNVITFEAISAFIAGSPCIRHLRVRSDRTYNSCQDIHGIPMKVTLASLGAWMRTCRTRKPFSGVLNNTHAIRYWMQFASAHCANTGGVYGASTHWKWFRSLIVAGNAHPYRQEELESKIVVPSPPDDAVGTSRINVEVQDAAGQQDPLERV